MAEALLGDYMMGNLLAVGATYQAGLLPISAASIERAIELNGVQVADNVQAFRYGRLFVHDPARVNALIASHSSTPADEVMVALAQLSPSERRSHAALLERCAHLDTESRRMLEIRIAELIAYQNAGYATQYVDFVLHVAERERATLGTVRGDAAGLGVTQAVIRYLYKLMAYKDEYEVARLHLQSSFLEGTQQHFARPQRLVYHFHPPLLRAMGLHHKQEFGPWFRPVLGTLRRLRGLRGTPLDVFGYAKVRREERRAIQWYRELVDDALRGLTPETHQSAVELASLPDQIRGYEEIKLRNLERARESATALRQRMSAPPSPFPMLS
jgi:indolepyruvate ferredoxin oxidoreductase